MSHQDAACYYCVGNIEGVLPTEDFVCGRHRALLDDARQEAATLLLAVEVELERKARIDSSGRSDPKNVLFPALQSVADAIAVVLRAPSRSCGTAMNRKDGTGPP